MNVIESLQFVTPVHEKYALVLVTDQDAFIFEHLGVQHSSPYPVLWYHGEGAMADGSVISFTYKELQDVLNSLLQYRTRMLRVRKTTSSSLELINVRATNAVVSIFRCNAPTLIFVTSKGPEESMDAVLYNGIIGTPSVDPTHLLSSIVESYGNITHFAIE
ncbi:p18 [Beet yellow stunt virus]|uniref:p18 n=1 Tax=Beet yellow stunt virus TaxID=35290 RepID=Q65859_9CLOS|nr:p18 [Beet yellow stunt virus]AAC55666.1 p18 [Beet yellow stunt virus]